MKKFKIFDCVIFVNFVVQLFLILQLPDIVPLHWDMNFKVDVYGSTNVYLLMLCLPMVCYYGMNFTRKIDPKRAYIEKKRDSYEFIRRLLSIFFIFLVYILILSAKNPDMNISQVMMMVFGMFFVFFGNEMPKLPQSYYLGIRNRYTLESEKVWDKTHRMAGYLFCFSGMAFILASILVETEMFSLFIMSLIIMVFIIYWYSYNEYKKEGK